MSASLQHARLQALQRHLGTHENALLTHALLVLDGHSIKHIKSAPLAVFTHLARQGKFQYKNLRELSAELAPAASHAHTRDALAGALFEYARHISCAHHAQIVNSARFIGRFCDGLWSELGARKERDWWDHL